MFPAIQEEQNSGPCLHKHGWCLYGNTPPPPRTITPPFFVPDPQVFTPHQPRQAINEDHQGVAGGSRLRTPGQVSTHGLEYVYAPGQLWLTHTHTDIDNFTSTVLDHITTTIDSITTTKRITTYPNRKPWMNKEVWLLLKARNTAFRSGEAQAYSTARANLRRGIKKAKHTYKRKIEGHFSSSDPRRMWQGIQAITDYKPNNSSPTVMDTTFLNELNTFYARFEKDDKDTATRTPLPADHQPITLSSTAVYTALSRINPRKAAGPDGIPGRVLRACAEQLAGIFTDIFNLTSAQLSTPSSPPS
ncbi:uncharacterized protein LOC130521308 [Takifugu flavidus]|uniref:uncharacterized protein LOC130521308 n=1 Tax=Takifugu flavidus TaxID=433684 RepID=UPI00254473C8|nr:uncharacterized protein LOC130521308 [Takifugu flavidus]